MIIKLDFNSDNGVVATFPISEKRAQIVQYKRFDNSWVKEKMFAINMSDGLQVSEVVVDE